MKIDYIWGIIPMRHYTIVFLLALLVPVAAQCQVGIGIVIGGGPSISNVKIYNKANKKIPFIIKGKPRLELLNGKLNIAVISTKNQQLQIIGIDEKFLRDTVVKSSSVQTLYITANQEHTWVSNPAKHKTTLVIGKKKKQKLNRVSITVNSRVYSGDQEYRVEAMIHEPIPPASYQITN